MIKVGDTVVAQGRTGAFKVMRLDGTRADIQAFNISKQMTIGPIEKDIPCSILHRFKEDASQAAARIVREATQD